MATNSFAGTDVPTLYRTVMSGKPDTLTKMAAAWTAVGGVALGESSDMTDNLDTLQTYWQSPVARDAYTTKVRQGIDAMAGASDAATPVATQLTAAATALTTAQKDIAPIYQQYVTLLAQIQQSTSGTNPALLQQLQQLQQQAAQVVQALSDAYTTAANGIKPIADPLAGSTTNGQNNQSNQNDQQATSTATTASTQQGTTRNGATAANQPTATPAATPAATTTPTATATATPTTGTLGSVGSVGTTGGVTVPPVTTTPVGTTPIGTPITPIGTVLPLTPVSKGSSVGGGVSEDLGVGGLPGEVLPVAALPGEALPGGAVPVGTATVAEPGRAAAETGTAENGMMMPFMPGGMGGFPAGGTGGSKPRRPGGGLFDEETEPDGRIGPGGVIEAGEDGPVLPYGITGGGRERDRKRRPGGGDGWDDGAAVAPAVLVGDPVPHR